MCDKCGKTMIATNKSVAARAASHPVYLVAAEDAGTVREPTAKEGADNNHLPAVPPHSFALGDRVRAIVDWDTRDGTIVGFYDEWKGETHVPRVEFDRTSERPVTTVTVSATRLTKRADAPIPCPLCQRGQPCAENDRTIARRPVTRDPGAAALALEDARAEMYAARSTEAYNKAARKFEKCQNDLDNALEGCD